MMTLLTRIILGSLSFIGLLIIFFGSLRIVRPTEKALVERFGKYNRYVNDGLLVKLPFIERAVLVNITEIMIDAEPQEIITKDKLNAKVDAQVYYKIKKDEVSVKNSQYNVDDVGEQIVSLVRTTLRNIIGGMTLVKANEDRNEINSKLLKTLKNETSNWGIDIVRAELKEINPPKDVQEVMNKVVIAENEKTSAVDFATATETKADGEKKAKIKEAEGRAKSIELVANAEAEATKVTALAKAEAIKSVNESASKTFKGGAELFKRYEVTEASLKDNAKIILTEKGISPTIVFGEGGILPLKATRSK